MSLSIELEKTQMSFFGGHITYSDCCLLRGYFPVFIMADICLVFSKLLHWLSFLARTRKQIFTETGFHSTFVGQFPSEWDAHGLIVETERLQFCDKRYTCDTVIIPLIKRREPSHQCTQPYLFDQIPMYLVTHQVGVFLTPCVTPIYVSGFLMTHIPKAPSGHF